VSIVRGPGATGASPSMLLAGRILMAVASAMASGSTVAQVSNGSRWSGPSSRIRVSRPISAFGS